MRRIGIAALIGLAITAGLLCVAIRWGDCALADY